MASGRETRRRPPPNYKEPDLRRVGQVEVGDQNASRYVLCRSSALANRQSQRPVNRKAAGNIKGTRQGNAAAKQRRVGPPLKTTSRVSEKDSEIAECPAAKDDSEEGSQSEAPEEDEPPKDDSDSVNVY